MANEGVSSFWLYVLELKAIPCCKGMDSDTTNGGFHDEVKAVTIRIFYSRETAGLAAANLQAHGIECWIKADDCGGMYPSLSAAGGVRLLVHTSDVEAAIALLDAPASPADMNQIEIEAIASSSPEAVPLKKLAMGQIISGLVVGVILGILLCLLYQWADNIGIKTYYHYTRDGKQDEAWIYRDGYPIEFLKDRNVDGVWDEWTYYEHGQAVRSEYDNNFDEKPDEWWTFADGRMDTLQKDADFNGIPDEFCTYKYGIIQQMDMKPNGAKFVTQRWIYQNGVLTEILRGGDSNGNFKEDVRYDPFFNPIGINNSTDNSTAFQLLTPSSK